MSSSSRSSRREQLSDRLAETTLIRRVIGPKVLEPAAAWYREKVKQEDDEIDLRRDAPGRAAAATDTTTVADTTTVTETRSPSGVDRVPATAPAENTTLASAQAAEVFLAGPDASDDPRTLPTAPTLASPNDAPAATAPTGQEAPAPGEAPRSRLAGFKAVAMGVKGRIKDHNLNVVAAGVAFWGLLAIPAILTAVVSIYGLVSSPDEVESQIEDALSGASEDVQSIVGDQLRSVAGGSSGGLATGAAVGIVLALWTSSGAVAKMIATLNTIWEVGEDRKFLKLRGLAITITLGAIVFVAGTAFLLAVLPAVLGEAGFGDAARWALNIARFPAMLIVMTIGLSVLYWAGPNRRRPFRLVTWGAAWATVLWLVMSGLFSIYTASFASYNETYGSLGAVVVMLLWLFLTAFMVLIGAEIDAEREARKRATQHGQQ